MDSTNPVDRAPADPLSSTALSIPAAITSPSASVAEALDDREFDDDGDPHRHRLSEQQQLALDWLMNGCKITEAAELVGVQRRTVSRWVNHHHAFKCLYDDWQEHLRTGLEARVMSLAEAAMDNLTQAIRTEQDVKASQFILKLLGLTSQQRRRRQVPFEK